MTVAIKTADVVNGVAIVSEGEELTAFLDPACAAAIWRRQPEPGFQRWINDLDPQNLPQGRIILHRHGVRQALGEFCESAGTPTGAQRDHLIDDITSLATLFAELMNARYLRLRLEAVTTNACRKFHIDAITSRLVCTYRGVGTQFGTSPDGADPARIFTTPTGAPILLRGTLWPDQPALGLLHRSPPIEGTGEVRLVLVLDPVFDPEDEI